MTKVSVVTVAYNEIENIERTLKSVLSQTFPEIEYVVIDGGSTDGTVDVIKKYANRLSYWISERDGGLYFGMNKGLDKCTGDYVIFCNAGDVFASEDVLEKMVVMVEKDGGADLVFGDSASDVNGLCMVRKAHGLGFMRFGMPTAHEAMLYKMVLIHELRLRYDTSYRIAADYKFTYQFVNAHKISCSVNIPVVVFSMGGISTSNQWSGLKEMSRVRREVGGLSLFMRFYINVLQSVALILATYMGPFYRVIRLQRDRSR